MSGVTSSQRQWMSKRVRALAASLLALVTLIPMFGVASAQTLPALPPPYPADNQMCITGTVINFDETLVTEDVFSQPLLITAAPEDPTAARIEVRTTDGTFEFNDLTPGVWTITLTLPPNFVPVDPYKDNFQVTIGYGMHECVEVRFKIKRPVPVEVLKIDDNHLPLSGWIIRAAPAHRNWFASPVEVETDDQGIARFNLTEGKWVFTERPPDGQAFTPVMPASGKQEVDIEWDPDWGDTPGKIMLRFKNRLTFHGCIAVTKTDFPPNGQPAYGLPGWKITVKRLNGTVVATQMTDAQGNARFNNLPYGPYIVSEESRLGWEPTAASSYSVVVSRPQTTAPDTSGCEIVDFINRQAPPGFCIEGYKIDHNGKIGIPGWTITATAVYAGSFPNPDVDVDPTTGQPLENLVVTTDGTGKYVIDMEAFGADVNDYRLPGAAYRVCEEKRDGWLPHTAVCQTVYLPRKPGACVKAWNFVNQQVGHSESKAYGGGSSSSSGAGCRSTHTVVAGESLFGIGNAYGVSGSAMLSANPWIYNRPHHYVYVGDHVCIP